MKPKYFTTEQIITLEKIGLSKGEIKKLYSYAKTLTIHMPFSMDKAVEGIRNVLNKAKFELNKEYYLCTMKQDEVIFKAALGNCIIEIFDIPSFSIYCYLN